MTKPLAHSVEIVAEAGVNHNGDVGTAISLIDAAAGAGADTIKFQTFRPEELASKVAPKARYQESDGVQGDTQLQMLRELALSPDAHRRLLARCAERGIEFLSTPFDHTSLGVLVNDLGQRRIKISSGDLTNAPLLLAAAQQGVDLVVSTGMATMGEIADALAVIAFGFLGPAEPPGTDAFRRAYEDQEGQRIVREKVVLLQCTTSYPTPFDQANLRAMEGLHRSFGCPVGFSDHTIGIEAAIAAAALGATIIEKHLTLDRAMPGPDHRASVEPDTLAEMVSAIRNVELALGDESKAPTTAEGENMAAARKSLVARATIRRGETFTPENLAVKRPGLGISAMRYWDWLGKQADRDYDADEIIGC